MPSTRQVLDGVRNISFWMALAGFCAFIAGWRWGDNTLPNADSLLRDRLFLNEPFLHQLVVYLAGNSLCVAGATTVLCAVIARTFLGGCGRCHKLLSRAMSCDGRPWAISRFLRFCPYCAAAIDERMPRDALKETMDGTDANREPFGAGSESTRGIALPTGLWSELLTDAIRFWEPRRLIYNAVLALVVVGYFLAEWPASRAALHFNTFLFLFALAVMANLCYCAAYVADLFVQLSGFQSLLIRWRWLLLALGIAFAAIITRFIVLGLISTGGPG